MKTDGYESSNLYKIRHTAAHVLAMAAKEFDPKVKLAIGPPIEDGFYYDFEFSKPVSEDDLPKLEASMKKIIEANLPVEHSEMERTKAVELFKKEKQNFKTELAEDLEDTKVSFYKIGDFDDLCKGPHVKSTGEIKAFKLLGVAGAYWRGSEKNQMLTRIYGTAWENRKQLDEYLHQLEEAKKRDHKKLGRELDLFIFSDLVGPGLPLWTPKGTVMREILDDFVWELRAKRGYQKVEIPHLTKKELYEKSGHWEKFQNELFKIQTREGHTFALKPMNCPHHIEIFDRKKWSYREMPQRYANTTMVYRDEQTGELSGLSRVRAITQDDAHVFCRADQATSELAAIWEIVEEFYGALEMKLRVQLSFRDPKQPEKYLGDEAIWTKTESELKTLAKKKQANASIAEGEANFYGPKIDFMAEDSLKRQWQVATIQLDMIQPERFGLSFINDEGKEEKVVMIHAAIMGSIERCLSIIIEHFAGNFPVWLAPVQAKIVPISEKFEAYAAKIAAKLQKDGVRFELEDSAQTLGKRIRTAEMEKVPYIFIIGEKEANNGTVTVRSRKDAAQKILKLNDLNSLFATERR